MRLRGFKSLLIVLLALLLSTGTVFSQDSVTRKSGTTETGTIKIEYVDVDDDLVVLVGQNRVIPAADIERIELENGRVFISAPITYYNTSSHQEVDKNALLEILASGPASLYKYGGRDFDFAMKTSYSLNVLQDISPGSNTRKVSNYSVVLLNNLMDCIDSNLILDSELNQNSLLHIFNTYNSCTDSNYSPITIADKKVRDFYFGVAAGPHMATHNFFMPVMEVIAINPQQAQLQLVNTVEETNAFSIGRTIEIFFQNNIGNSRNLFLEYGFSNRSFIWEMNAVDGTDYNFRDLKVKENAIHVGLNYQFSPQKKFTPEISGGPFFWNMGNQVGVIAVGNYDIFPLITSQSRREYGLGGYANVGFSYQVAERIFLFSSAKYYLRNGNDLFTYDKDDFYGEPADDKLTSQFSFSFGVKLGTFREGYF